MSRPLNTQDLELLREYARFGYDGEPLPAAKFLCRLLSLTPFPDHEDALVRLLPDEGLYYLIAYMANDAGVITHGGNISGSWLVPEGEELLARLADVDWDLPFDPTPSSVRPVSEVSPPETIAIVDPSVVSTIAFPEEGQFKNVFWDMVRATEPDEVDIVCNQSGFCGCGEPVAALKLYFVILQSIADGTGEFERHVPDPGMRQFMLYQLHATGITSGIAAQPLSEFGEEVRQQLAALEMKGYRRKKGLV